MNYEKIFLIAQNIVNDVETSIDASVEGACLAPDEEKHLVETLATELEDMIERWRLT